MFAASDAIAMGVTGALRNQDRRVPGDETMPGGEAANGGFSVLFSGGQPGLTTNLLLREGYETTQGDIMVSATTYGARRIDGYLSGKLSKDTYQMAGG